jgi:hypothetical protein
MFAGTDVTRRGRRVGSLPKQILLKVTASTSAAERNLGSTSSDVELSYETEISVSDQGGHDHRRPKRRVTDSDVGASKWTLEEWRLLLTTGDASDSKESSDDDGKPQRCAKPSIPKAKWSAADAQRSIARSLRFLQNKRKEAPFRALALPSSIDPLEADVSKGKALADAETWLAPSGFWPCPAWRRPALMPWT